MTDPADHQRHILPSASDLLERANRPVDLIAHAAWGAARETVLALASAGPALIALLGPPGTGKTVLLRDLVTAFRECGRVACLLEFPDSSLNVEFAEMVLVDEADRITVERLEELRSRDGVTVVLAALPPSRERFERYLDVTVVQLAPLSPEQACGFVTERLAQLGLPKSCLTEAAWVSLIAHAHGIPRLLIALLGFALFLAGEDHAERVTGAHVERALEARGGSMEHLRESASDDVSLLDTSESASDVVELDWISEPPPNLWRTRVAAVALIATVYLGLSSALIAWGIFRGIDTSGSLGPGELVALGTEIPTSVPARMEQLAALTPTAPVSVLQSSPVGQGAVGAEPPVRPVTPPPGPPAMKPDDAALLNAAPHGRAQTTAATPDQSSAALPSRDLPTSPQPVSPLASNTAPPRSFEASRSPAPERNVPRRGGSGVGQGATAVAMATGSNVKIARRTMSAPPPTEERGRLQSPVNGVYYHNEIGGASWQDTTTARPPLSRVPNSELPSKLLQMRTRETSPAVQQLLSARKALLDNNPPEARVLLGAAQTSIVFGPADAAPERAAAAVQISEALSILNSGNVIRALPCLDRAITWMQSTL